MFSRADCRLPVSPSPSVTGYTDTTAVSHFCIMDDFTASACSLCTFHVLVIRTYCCSYLYLKILCKNVWKKCFHYGMCLSLVISWVQSSTKVQIVSGVYLTSMTEYSAFIQSDPVLTGWSKICHFKRHIFLT